MDRIFEHADLIRRCFRKETRLRHFLESPRIRKDEKHATIDRMFSGRVEPLLLSLIHVMLGNNRVENLDETLRLVCDLVDLERGIVPATVTTATALADEQRKNVHETLEKQLGLRFDIRFRTDPNLLGGMIFKFRDRLLDGSLRFDLQKLRDRLMAVPVV